MHNINYSQCWEDTNMLTKALAVQPEDTVVSITSGGDNTIALLLEKPAKLYSIDINPAQNHLAALKLIAPKTCTHSEYLELLGATASTTRIDYYNKVADLLPKSAQKWFAQNYDVIARGIIHRGKFERYMNGFRKYILPFVHTKRTVSAFADQPTLQSQIAYYETTWNTWRWKLFFSIATNTSLLTTFGRQRGAAHAHNAAHETYFHRLERLIYRSHISVNPYIHYALTGLYGEVVPNYLSAENFKALQALSNDAYELKTEDLGSFLRQSADASLDKFNLSDTFEFIPAAQTHDMWREIVRTAKNGARVVYWCNQVEHTPPRELAGTVRALKDESKELAQQDRLYFYRSFHVYTILK